jgi:hypothetical protein
MTISIGRPPLFEKDWDEGYRPALDMSSSGCRDEENNIISDILYMSRFGSYVRERACENNVEDSKFHALHNMCQRQRLHARRDHTGNHQRVSWPQREVSRLDEVRRRFGDEP